MVEFSYETKNIIHRGQNMYPIFALASTKQWPNQNSKGIL